MNNGEALASIMASDNMDSGMEQAPVQEVAQPEAIPQQEPSVPQFDPSIMVGALDNIHGRLDQYEQYFNKPAAQPAPSEEERIIQEVAKKLGLDKVAQENQTLKQTLEQMQGSIQQQQAFIEEQQINSVQSQILSKYQGITKDMVMGKLVEMANTYGEEFANNLNNPKGWEYVISQHIQKAPATPDPIVSTEAGSSNEIQNVSERVTKGDIQQGDLGKLLSSYFN